MKLNRNWKWYFYVTIFLFCLFDELTRVRSLYNLNLLLISGWWPCQHISLVHHFWRGPSCRDSSSWWCNYHLKWVMHWTSLSPSQYALKAEHLVARIPILPQTLIILLHLGLFVNYYMFSFSIPFRRMNSSS